jgi:hypothetical protein
MKGCSASLALMVSVIMLGELPPSQFAASVGRSVPGEALAAGTSEGLVTTTWHQGWAYNGLCPIDSLGVASVPFTHNRGVARPVVAWPSSAGQSSRIHPTRCSP